MQVSSIETAPGAGSGKEATKPSQAASDAFAILLQNALTQNPAISTLKIHGESTLADHFTADNPSAAEMPRSAARDSDTADDPDTLAAQPDDDGHADAVDARHQASQDARKAAERDAANLAALTNATEARISLSRTQSNSAAVAQQDRAATQGTAKTIASDGSTAAGNAQTALNTQEPKAPANYGSKQGSDTGANAGRATAQVTDGGQNLISRPASTLSGAATLPTQSGTQEKQAPVQQPGAANAGSTDSAIKSGLAGNGDSGRNAGSTRLAENGGNLLLNSGEGKTATANAGNNGQKSAQQAQTLQNGSSNTPSGLQQAAAPVQPTPVQPPQPSANGRQTPVVERAPSLPVTDSAPTIGAGQSGAPSTSSTARVAPPVPARPAAPPSDLKEQISVQVQKAVEQGIDRIRIQLKPADLGRLEIQLDVAQDGKVSIVVNADRSETLEMLRRDARGLQQALQDAGLQTESGGLSFKLGGGNASFGDQLADGNRPEGGNDPNSVEADENGAAADSNHHRRSSNSTIDVEV